MAENHQIGKPPEFKGKIWRRGRDSNPRYPKGKRDFESRAFNRARPPLRNSRSLFFFLRSPKKLASNAAHSWPSTSAVTASWWFNRESSHKRYSDFTAPALGSKQPKTSRRIRACKIAPTHMMQGSRVTYSSHSLKRQLP